MKKKIVIIIAAIVVIAAAGTGIWYFTSAANDGGSKGNEVYVESVASLTGSVVDMGTTNNFSGEVEPQKTEDIKADSTKKVKEIFVNIGDEVSVDTPLFEYDSDDIAMSITQAQLEIDKINNGISAYNSQITDLEKERKSAAESEKLSYTTQIQSIQIQIKQDEYNRTVKELELQKLQESVSNTIVYSTMNGVIKEINENGGIDNLTGEELPFISILAIGDYRVKGIINEQNIYDLQEGDSVIVTSRVDSSITWKGIVDLIDRENTVSDSNEYYGYSDSASSTKYNFYVSLENADDLMLGQHVYIKKDLGMGDASQKEGIWLFDWYVVTDDDGTTYVWASDSKGKLEKREVELGDYDDTMGQYQIKSGLDTTDYIAFPEEGFEEGTGTIKIGDEMSYNTEVKYDIRA